MFVKFTESRVHRRGNIITKFQCGEHYPFNSEMMQQYVDIGHAVECDADGNALSLMIARDVSNLEAGDFPAPDGDGHQGDAPLVEKRPAGRPKKAPAPLMNDDRAIEVPDVPTPNRDPVKNGGFTEE